MSTNVLYNVVAQSKPGPTKTFHPNPSKKLTGPPLSFLYKHNFSKNKKGIEKIGKKSNVSINTSEFL